MICPSNNLQKKKDPMEYKELQSEGSEDILIGRNDKDVAAFNHIFDVTGDPQGEKEGCDGSMCHGKEPVERCGEHGDDVCGDDEGEGAQNHIAVGILDLCLNSEDGKNNDNSCSEDEHDEDGSCFIDGGDHTKHNTLNDGEESKEENIDREVGAKGANKQHGEG